MKNALLCFFLASGFACASVTCTTNVNTLTGTLGNGTGSIGESGCLTVGGTNGAQNNLSGDGLWVNPATGSNLYQSGSLYVAWSVTGTTGDWNYTYTFSDTANELSHVDIGLGSSCTTATTASSQSNDSINNCIWKLSDSVTGVSGNFATCSTTSGSNKECGATFTSTENTVIQTPTQAESSANPILAANADQPWNTEQLVVAGDSKDSTTISFTSEYAPTWQNVWIQDASVNAGNNAAFTNTSNAVNTDGSTKGTTLAGTGFFIAAPGNSMQLTPEPGYYATLAVGLCFLFLGNRLRRRKSSSVA